MGLIVIFCLTCILVYLSGYEQCNIIHDERV